MLATYEVAGLPPTSGDLPATACSLAYFCTTCGSVWARVTVASSPWRVTYTPCEAHEGVSALDFCSVPGSLIDQLVDRHSFRIGERVAAADYLPAALRGRELSVHLKYFYKELERE